MDVRDAAEHAELFDWLVGRTIFANGDGVVGEEIDRWEIFHSGHTDGWLHVISED